MHPPGNAGTSASASHPPSDDAEQTTEQALTALRSSISQAAAEAMLMNHPTMLSTSAVDPMDVSGKTATTATTADLEQLSATQLQGRIVQLAMELKDRTKWEALRLKEFLAMKEQEVANE